MAQYGGMRVSQGKLAEAERLCRWLIDQAGENELGLGLDPMVRESLGKAYYNLDNVLISLGRVDEVNNWKKALAIFEDLGDFWQQGAVLENAGTSHQFQGRWDEAVDLWQRSREATLKAGDAVEAANLSIWLAEVFLDRGRIAEAEPLFREVLRIKRAAGHAEKLAWTMLNLGRTAARAVRFDEAMGFLEEALSAFERIGARVQVLETEARMAECLLFQGRWQGALEILSAIRHREIADVSLLNPLLHRLRGYALAQAGNYEPSSRAFEESLLDARAVDSLYDVALAIDAMARLSELEGKTLPDELVDEGRTILDRLGVIAPPHIPLVAPLAAAAAAARAD